MNRAILPIFLAFAVSCAPTFSFAAPKFSPDADFPTAKQTLNACYFYSTDIALRAKYGSGLRLKTTLSNIGFDGKTLATWEFKKKFSDATHVTVREYRTKKDVLRLLDSGEPVLVSTEIPVSGKAAKIRHVSVAYSYDDFGIWVSDPLFGKKRRLGWDEVFLKSGTVRFNALRTVSVKPYAKWNVDSVNREKKEDLWLDETKIR